MTTFDVRKRDELHYKLGGFFDEMTEWRQLSDKKAPLKKHYSQVRALTTALDALAARVRDQIDAADDLRGQWKQLAREVVALHTVWAFYRDKWALRQLTQFRQYLILADEFAWATYKPAQEAFQRVQGEGVRTREPPLVFLGTAHGAWSLARGDSGQDDVDQDLVRNTVVQELVRRLPLPVVALPWHELSHLPDVIVLGHEVGHLVLVDFVGLDTVLELADNELVELGAGAQARHDWANWAEEAFADAYGVLSGGPAFAQTLGDVIVARGVENELADTVYPQPVLRLAVLAGALDEVVGAQGATAVLDAWREDGVEVSDAVGFEHARRIGQALVRGPYPMLGGALTTIIEPLSIAKTRDLADRLVQGLAPQTDQIRMLVASTVTAFRSHPDVFQDRRVHLSILSMAEQIESPGYRFTADPEHPDAGSAPDLVEDLWSVLADTTQPATTRAGADD